MRGRGQRRRRGRGKKKERHMEEECEAEREEECEAEGEEEGEAEGEKEGEADLCMETGLRAFVVDRKPSPGRVIGYGQYKALVFLSVLHGDD
ncbi:hypothetical protein ACLB2K_059501 [Fragaria x ananassa]